jgi:hypothetical protein
MKYYCLIFRWCGVSQIEIYDHSSKFGVRVAELFRLFDAPSTLGVWSTWAESPETATEKAKVYFEKDGWSL